jgi:hypothetical protein
VIGSNVFTKETKLGVVLHTCHPSIWETKGGESQVQGHPGLHSEALSEREREREKKERGGRERERRREGEIEIDRETRELAFFIICRHSKKSPSVSQKVGSH